MSRRDAGDATSHGARHAGTRLQASLGSGPGGLLPGSGEGFAYSGGTHPSEDIPGAAGGHGNGTMPAQARTGPVLRWRLGLKVALLVGLVAVLCGAWFWWQVATGQPEVLPLGDVTPSEGTAAPAVHGAPAAPGGTPGTADGAQGQEPTGTAQATGSPSGGADPAVLHVAGAVARPGIVQLAPGSRVHDAIAAAGGSTPDADLDRLNLAAVVADGQKVYVPRRGEPLPDGSAGSATDDAGGDAGPGATGLPLAGGKTNLNTAGVEELAALPKVGPVMAQRIVDWRTNNGPFKSVQELDAVEGVGPKMLETLLPLVSAG